LLGPKVPGQLVWILFFFIFGAVLIARISMDRRHFRTRPALRAGHWRPCLVGTAGLCRGFNGFINALLIVLIWWSTHRLTYDSTLIDDKQDASGAGLLQVVGLDDKAQPGKPAEETAPQQVKKRKREPGGLEGWFQRYQKYRAEANQRPHAPGVWVVWFSLAALPLFGIGQSLIPPVDAQRRRYAFWLMAIYVGSGLGCW